MLWRTGAGAAQLAAWLFLAGGFIFAATLYLMAFGAPRWLGAVTPIGGLLMILAWGVLAYAAIAGAKTTLV